MCEHLYGQCCQKIRKNVLQTTRKVYVNLLGLPLLTVETEANGDSKSTNEKGPCLVVSLGSWVPVQEIFYPALAALDDPLQKIFFLAILF
jgi:hypothetical protein